MDHTANMASVSGYNLTSNMDYSSLNMGKRSSIHSSVIGGANLQFVNKVTVQMAGASNSKLNEPSKQTKKTQFLKKNSIINPYAMIDDQKSSVSNQRGTS
jgi:hypothetical protein